MALATDLRIQSALARLRAARADSDQARLLPNPVLSVAVRFPEGGGTPIIDASLTEELIAILVRPRRVSAADNRLRAASSEAVVTVLDVLAEVQDVYTSVQSLESEIEVLRDRRRIIQRLLDLSKARLELGEASQLDVISFEADRAALDVDIAQKQTEATQQRLVLTRLIGKPSGAADWELDRWSEPISAPSVESNWIATALQKRPEIQARQWELAALGDDLALARWAPLEGTEVGADSERDPDWSVGPAISVPIPIFDWGQARRRRVSADVIAARHELTRTQRQVVEDVRRAYSGLTATEATLAQIRRDLIPLQERRREQAEAAYRNGFTDITTVLLAEQDSQESRSKLVELQREVSSARIRLERAAGGPGVVESMPKPATQPATGANTEPGLELK